MEVNLMTGGQLVTQTEQQVGAMMAARVRLLRAEQCLSLDALAKLTGLSKGTVVALEQGKANPSIAILCRLAAAFSLSVSDLVSSPADSVSDLPIERTMPRTLWTSPKGSKAELHASTSGRTMFELWSWIVVSGDEYHAEAHSPNTRELISVSQGSLKVTVGTNTLILKSGGCARLTTDQPHSYACTSEGPAHFTMAVLERGEPRSSAAGS